MRPACCADVSGASFRDDLLSRTPRSLTHPPHAPEENERVAGEQVLTNPHRDDRHSCCVFLSRRRSASYPAGLSRGTEHPGTAPSRPRQRRSTAYYRRRELRAFPERSRFRQTLRRRTLPVSSGKSHRMRLHRGGNRQANRVIYLIAIWRLRYDSRSQA